MEENEKNYLINIEQNLVNKEMIDIEDRNFKKVMFLYSAALKEIKTKIEIIGFFIFTCSFFLLAFSKFINLYLEIVKVLKNITAKYITAK